jgi:hypothetical protein
MEGEIALASDIPFGGPRRQDGRGGEGAEEGEEERGAVGGYLELSSMNLS